ncbi:MAG: T9SS type A sorting domain-containing protein [Bacteroidaceae bacterium]|nr:T9SS type A sorting domain-containing protein [Bacteroidaceae bacterium]MEA4974536.1 T9SS type A sorting domain-containing protein [Paludibacter sp.]
MNKIYCIIVLLLSYSFIASQTTNVEFNYDADGNMILRKIIVVPSNIKGNPNQDDVISEEIGQQKIKIYPNPTNGIIKLDISEIDDLLNNYCLIYSLNGTLLLKKKISGSLTEIDLSSYETGSYLMDICLGDKTSRWKVIKQ